MNPVTGLCLGRIGVGVASLARPDLVASALGSTGAAPLMTRWFGTREIALGVVTLLASGSGRRTLVRVGAAVDGADAVTAAAAVRSRELARPLGLGLVVVAAGATAVGLADRTTDT